MQRKKDPVKYCACGCGKMLKRKRRRNGRLESPQEFEKRLYVNRTHYFNARYHSLDLFKNFEIETPGDDGRENVR